MQLAAEIMACGSENAIRKITDQITFAMRANIHAITFYKATILKEYWADLQRFLKRQSV